MCVLVVFQRLLDEQQGKLSQYESAAGHCVSELQKAQLQVRSLQAKIRESEAGNQVPLPPQTLYISVGLPIFTLLDHSRQGGLCIQC